MGKTIGHTKDKEGLYYLEAGNGSSNILPFSYHSTKVSINKAQIGQDILLSSIKNNVPLLF